jgi:glycine cleavage system H protein
MDIPSSFRYTPDHEWLEPLGEDRYRMGITEYAQDQLGDVVFVETGAAGRIVEAGAVVAEVESTKSVGEIYAPARLEVVAVNETIRDRPELVNQEPYGAGWLFEARLLDPLPDSILDAEAYRLLID